MDIMKNLVEKVKKELTDVADKNFSIDEANSFYEWMKVEYKNYMMVSREAFLNTLDVFESKYPDYKKLSNVLRNNIEDYGAIQAFLIASIELTTVK